MQAELDFVVVGGGSGGMAAAKRAASLGARVALVERGRMGGTCVLRGCIPKKLMVYAAERAHAQAHLADFALDGPGPVAGGRVDWPRLVIRREAVIERLSAGHLAALDKAGVQRLAGTARFTDAHTLQVGDGALRFRHALVAVGGAPRLPDFEGGALCLSSDGFFELRAQPRRAVVLGGGYIAVELAGILARLGTPTTLVVRSTLLRAFDADLVAGLREACALLPLEVLEHTDVESVAAGEDASASGDGATRIVHVRGPDGARALHGDVVIAALGRTPETGALQLSRAGIEVNDRGAILADAEHRTSCRHIFAVGDVTESPALTPVAIRHGRRVAHLLFGAHGSGPAPIELDHVTTAVFGHPPLACVGLTEAAARERHGDDVAVRMAKFRPLRALMGPPERSPRAIVKVVLQPSCDRVLGVHLLADDAPEIVQGMAVALGAGLTGAQLDATLALHPTLAEELVLMGPS